jgi:hypothetical protein
MLEEQGFGEEVGASLGMSMDVGGAAFERARGIEAARLAYEKPKKSQALEDMAGRTWEMKVDPDDGWSLLLRHEKTGYRIRGILGLQPTAKKRLELLDATLRERKIAPAALKDWRERLAKGPIEAADIQALDQALGGFPPFGVRALSDSLDAKGLEPSQIVPPTAAYYERLVGKSDAKTLTDFLKDPMRGEIAWLDAGPVEQARWLLLRAARPGIIAGVGLEDLTLEELRELGTWAAEDGDLIAKTAFVELALPRAHEEPDIEALILRIAADIEALDPDKKDGSLNLLSGLAVFVDGELSLQGTLAGWPPFRRRQAALAQASLVSRVIGGAFDTGPLADYCMAERGWRFLVQNLMDLRKEPRWRPDSISADQLRNELLGRIANAASSLPEAQRTPGLMESLLAPTGSLQERLAIPMVFWPGPLEGGTDCMLHEASAELQKVIEDSLAAEPVTAHGLNALINTQMMFGLPDELIEQATAAIQEAGPKLLASADPANADAYLLGIAGFAAMQRLPELADTVQILARYQRNRQQVPLEQEMQLMLVACASREDETEWRDRIGTWSLELAARIDDPEQAKSMLGWLDNMCEVDPVLRTRTGRARANLNLVLGQ